MENESPGRAPVAMEKIGLHFRLGPGLKGTHPRKTGNAFLEVRTYPQTRPSFEGSRVSSLWQIPTHCFRLAKKGTCLKGAL